MVTAARGCCLPKHYTSPFFALREDVLVQSTRAGDGSAGGGVKAMRWGCELLMAAICACCNPWVLAWHSAVVLELFPPPPPRNLKERI